MFKSLGALALLGAGLLAAAPASADTVLSDKTSTAYDDIGLSNLFTKLNDCGCSPADNTAVIDTFSLTSRSQITGVNAALVAIQQNAVSNFTGFGNALGYQVNIYSSADAALANLTGDIYSTTLAPSAVSFGSGFSTGLAAQFEVAETLAHLAVNVVLDPGTYWLSVVGIDNPDDNESIGVALSGLGAAKIVNPAGDLGIPNNSADIGENAGYAVLGVAGVPEPASWALMIAGFGLAGAALRRRRAVLAI